LNPDLVQVFRINDPFIFPESLMRWVQNSGFGRSFVSIRSDEEEFNM